MPDFTPLSPEAFSDELAVLEAKVPVTFDAQGDETTARPNVPAETMVIWFNTPSEPVNLGVNDAWEDTS